MWWTRLIRYKNDLGHSWYRCCLQCTHTKGHLIRWTPQRLESVHGEVVIPSISAVLGWGTSQFSSLLCWRWGNTWEDDRNRDLRQDLHNGVVDQNANKNSSLSLCMLCGVDDRGIIFERKASAKKYFYTKPMYIQIPFTLDTHSQRHVSKRGFNFLDSQDADLEFMQLRKCTNLLE